MAFNLASIKPKTNEKPPIMTFFGAGGLGKTTLASAFPNNVFAQTEEGQGLLTIDAFPLIEKLDDLHEAIATLTNEDHGYSTFTIDTIDGLEFAIHDAVAKRERVASISDIGYGRGYALALDSWRQIMDSLERLRDKKGMTIILIAHAKKERIDDPLLESYTRNALKLDKRAAPFIVERSDIVGYCKHDVKIKRDDQGFGSTRVRGVSTGRRLLQLVESAGAVAKNRYDLPDEIELSYPALIEAITKSINAKNEEK